MQHESRLQTLEIASIGPQRAQRGARSIAAVRAMPGRIVASRIDFRDAPIESASVPTERCSAVRSDRRAAALRVSAPIPC